MLEALRKNSRNTIIYVLFAILIAVFVTTFGPASRGGCGGGPATTFAAKVGGETVTEKDFNVAYMEFNLLMERIGQRYSPQIAKMLKVREHVMDKLIERELLAQEAERLGLVVSQKEVEDMIGEGRAYVLGTPAPLDPYAFADGSFNYEHFKAVCENRLGVSVARYLEEQRREMMAERMRQLMSAGAKNSPDEVKVDWLTKETKVNLAFVRFQSSKYVDEVELTPAEIATYEKTHEAEIKKYYEEHAYQYKKLDRQVHVKRISVAVAKGATPADDAAAKAKAEDALKRLKAGQDFAAVAKALSDEERSRARGGDAGWKKKLMSGLGQAIEDKLFAAKKGDLVGPDKSDRGYEVLLVDDFREGDVPYETAKTEIAAELLRPEKAKEKAKAEAATAMAKVKADSKLETVFPKAPEGEDAEKQKPGAVPSVQETGLFARRGDMVPDIGVSLDVLKKAFVMKPNEIAGPTEVAGSYVIYQLKEHKDPDPAEFDKHKAEIEQQRDRKKSSEIVEGWARQRCVEVRDRGKLSVNDEVLQYEGVSAGPIEVKVKYEPCAPPGNRML